GYPAHAAHRDPRRHAPDPGHGVQGPPPGEGGGEVAMSESSMRLGNIRPAAGATKDTKRRGKGAATGLGGTAGKGHKGKKARSGGQMPIQRRLPKRGFINPTRVEYHVVQVGRLAGAPAGTTIDAAWLRSARLVRRKGP